LRCLQQLALPVETPAWLAASTPQHPFIPQILPHRPEPWVHLAKLHHIWYDDPDMCFDFAAAGLAQRKPRADALFVNTLVSLGISQLVAGTA
jgi:hypothetical protein